MESTSQMDEPIRELVALLDRQIELIAQLHATLEREAEAIVHFDAAALSQSRASKQQLSNALQQCETRRIPMVAALASACGLKGSTASLAQLAERLTQPELARCHRSLRAGVQRVQGANRTNQVLLAHALETVRGSLSLLGHPGARNMVYCRSGRVENHTLQGSMLSSAL